MGEDSTKEAAGVVLERESPDYIYETVRRAVDARASA